MTLAERTIAALAQPFVLNGTEHVVRGSIGIAVAEGRLRESEDLVREADAAMYRAKERGRGQIEVYDDVMRARATDRLRIENDLRRALTEDELRVHYQPIVSLASGRVVGMEALARWQHPERGLLGPAEFIAVAEENGAIVEIGSGSSRRPAARRRRGTPAAPRPSRSGCRSTSPCARSRTPICP